MDTEQLKYPTGKYIPIADADTAQIEKWIRILADFPAKLNDAVAGYAGTDLDKTYRPGGWTVRQVIHHLADSHANAYIRLKLTLTEDNPTIRPYFEDHWAEVPDAKTADIHCSLNLIEAIHGRLVQCLDALRPEDFTRTYFHPEHQQQFDLKYLLGMYAWHGAHHLAHIKIAHDFNRGT